MNSANFVTNEESAKFIEPKHQSNQNNKKYNIFTNIFLLLLVSLGLALIGIFVFLNCKRKIIYKNLIKIFAIF